MSAWKSYEMNGYNLTWVWLAPSTLIFFHVPSYWPWPLPYHVSHKKVLLNNYSDSEYSVWITECILKHDAFKVK